jgi:signal transduction histidine kinase
MRERAGDRGGGWKSFRPWPALSIVHKLAGAMALPLAAVVVALAVEVRDIERESGAVREQAALAVSADGPSRLLISLQDEQAWAIVELVGIDAQADLLVEGYDETRRRTDDALTGFGRLLTGSPDETRAAFAPAVDGLADRIDAIRRQIDAIPGARSLDNLEASNEIFERYGRLIRPFFPAIEEVAMAVEQRELRQGAEILHLTGRQVAAVGDLGREVGVTALLAGGFREREDIASASALRSQFVRQAAAIRVLDTGRYDEAGDDELFVDYTATVVEQVDAAIEGRFDATAFVATLARPPDETYQAYRERVAGVLRDRADRLEARAAERERLYVALIVLAGLLVGGTVVVVARSITRPLRSLTEQVMLSAHQRLSRAVATVQATPLGDDLRVPTIEAIEVDTADEVGELAGAMNTVQGAVLDLAVEQAVLRRNLADAFVNLGRRNQNLLSRQMDVITELQRAEVDPDALAALFRLDHLATRMRRNAESLLVLAGIELPGRWRAPVPAVDVVRAALGEVEQYRRVQLTVVEPFTVAGHAASDLAHLLAELLENALLFSPPEQRVDVRGLTHAAGYTITITDAGVGMAPAEIARANRRLVGAESFTVAPSKYLGHYVAGHLAARHGLRAHLQPATGPGVVAIVNVPLALSAGRDPAPRRFTGEFPATATGTSGLE